MKENFQIFRENHKGRGREEMGDDRWKEMKERALNEMNERESERGVFSSSVKARLTGLETVWGLKEAFF